MRIAGYGFIKKFGLAVAVTRPSQAEFNILLF